MEGLQLHNNCFVSWLLYTVKDGPEKSTTLDCLYQAYRDYCYEGHIFPATLDYVSKVTEKVLPCAKRRNFREARSLGRCQITVFDGIECDAASSGTSCLTEPLIVHLPEFATLHVHSTDLPKSLSFSVPTVYTVNGTSVSVCVTIQDSVLALQLGTLDLDMGILDYSKDCLIDQKHIDGIVRLIKMMKLCRGKPYSGEHPYPPSACTPEHWGTIGMDQAETDKQVRWRSCKGVVGVNAKSETCVSCLAAEKNLRHVLGKRARSRNTPFVELSPDADKENSNPTPSIASEIQHGNLHKTLTVPVPTAAESAKDNTAPLTAAPRQTAPTRSGSWNHTLRNSASDTQIRLTTNIEGEGQPGIVEKVLTVPVAASATNGNTSTVTAAPPLTAPPTCSSGSSNHSVINSGIQEASCRDNMEEDEADLDVEMVTLEEEDHMDMNKIMKMVSPHVPKGFQDLLMSQLKNCRGGKDPRCRRWNTKLISICLSLYCRSPKAYEDLKNSGMVVLPSTRLLRYYKNAVDQHPGFVEENLLWMKSEAERRGITPIGRRGGLLLDEMQIQEDLQIKRDGQSWSLIGTVDMGLTSNNLEILMKKKEAAKLATHVLQLVFTGFTGFRWPVAYFTSSCATTPQLFYVVIEAVDILAECGFTIDYVMMDGASANRSLSKMVLGHPRPSSYATSSELDFLNGITFTQDIKHTFKKIRNSILTSLEVNKTADKGRYLLYQGHAILWDHWVAAAEFNVQGGFRIHNRLTTEHIELTSTSKMRNKLATDVLDKQMLRLMSKYAESIECPEELASTLCLLKHTSTLVDVFLDINRPIISLNDNRFVEVEKSLNFFNEWEKEVKSDVKLSSAKHLITQETRDDLNSAVRGFIQVAEKVVKLSHSIRPGFFNSDLVENMFCQQRGISHGCCTNPTVNQYGPGVNSIILGQLSVSRKCNSGVKTLHFGATNTKPLNKRKRHSTSVNDRRKKRLRL